MYSNCSKRYVYTWGNNPRRAELKGRYCRIIQQSDRKHSHRQFWRTCVVQFEDNGELVCTSLMALKGAEIYRSKQLKLPV